MKIELKMEGLLYLPAEILERASLRAGDQLDCEVIHGKIVLTPASFVCRECFPPTSWAGVWVLREFYALLERRDRSDSKPESQ